MRSITFEMSCWKCKRPMTLFGNLYTIPDQACCTECDGTGTLVVKHDHASVEPADDDYRKDWNQPMVDDLYAFPVSFKFEHPTRTLNAAMTAVGKKLFIYRCDGDSGWVYARDEEAARSKFGSREVEFIPHEIAQ